MNWLDYLLLVLLAVSMLIGIFRGFIKEALGIIVWIAALILAYFFAASIAQWIPGETLNHSVKRVIGFATIFICILLAGGLVTFIISEFVNKTGLSGMNRFLGAIFGVIRSIVILAIGIALVDYLPLTNAKVWHQSVIITEFQPVGRWLQAKLPFEKARLISKKSEIS